MFLAYKSCFCFEIYWYRAKFEILMTGIDNSKFKKWQGRYINKKDVSSKVS